jgi:hypothetical protein
LESDWGKEREILESIFTQKHHWTYNLQLSIIPEYNNHKSLKIFQGSRTNIKVFVNHIALKLSSLKFALTQIKLYITVDKGENAYQSL